MTEDIPLEITSSDMANLPIFIAVLIVAIVVVRVYFSIKHNEKPPIARVFWCATLLIPLGMVAAWITNQLLVNEDNSLWVLSYSALGASRRHTSCRALGFGTYRPNRSCDGNGCLYLP